MQIRDYKPFLIAVGQGGAYSDSMVYDKPFDTNERFKLVVKHSPYTVYPKIKNLVTQNWKDEQGADVFLPPTGVMNDPYEFMVEFVYYEADEDVGHNVITNNIRDFVNLIQGKWLKIYDTYTEMGRQGVYVTEFDQDPDYKSRKRPDGRLQNYVTLKVKFSVNDPNTDIKLDDIV